MGRRVIRGGAVSLSLLAMLGGCASVVRLEPAPEAEVGATLLGVYDSVGNGNETKYRQLVWLAPGDAYSDALTTTMFESIRLHQAVEQAFGNPASRPATTRPTSSLAAVDYRQNARAMLDVAQGWTFEVKGDRATIDQLAGRPGAPTFRRVDDHWMLVPPPWDTPADTATYRVMVESERRLAAALATARAAVADGRAKSVEDVNAILRNLLAEPATQP